jgi:hypothetical protein
MLTANGQHLRKTLVLAFQRGKIQAERMSEKTKEAGWEQVEFASRQSVLFFFQVL